MPAYILWLFEKTMTEKAAVLLAQWLTLRKLSVNGNHIDNYD